MSITAPVAGTLSATSPAPATTPAGSVVTINLKQPEQQMLVVVSGARQGLQIVVEAQDPTGLAPFYGVRATRQDTGAAVWGGQTIMIPDDPAGALPAVAVIAAIDGAGVARVRCVGLTSGNPGVALVVGSFFANSPVAATAATGGNSLLDPTTGVTSTARPATADGMAPANVPVEAVALFNGATFDRLREATPGVGDLLTTTADERRTLDLILLELVRIRTGIGLIPGVEQDLSDVVSSEDYPV